MFQLGMMFANFFFKFIHFQCVYIRLIQFGKHFAFHSVDIENQHPRRFLKRVVQCTEFIHLHIIETQFFTEKSPINGCSVR